MLLFLVCPAVNKHIIQDPLLLIASGRFHHTVEIENQQTSIGYLTTMLRYIFSAAKNLTEEQVGQIKKEIDQHHPKGSEIAMTMAERWMEEGMEEGMEKGQQLALSQMAMLQLTSKLGALPKDVKDRLVTLELSTLQALLSQVFSIEHIEDVRKYIQ